MSLHDDRLRRLTRLFLIAGHLQTGERVTLGSLAELCHSDRRTIQRDLDFLREADVQFIYNRGRRSYELTSPLPFAPISFAPPEILALMLAQETALGAASAFESDIRRAFGKVAASLPVALRQVLTEVAEAIAFDAPGHGECDPVLFDQLRHAQQKRETVRIIYLTRSRNEVSTRDVDPYKLFGRHGFWMLVGYCHKSGEVRQFSLDAIRSLHDTGKTFIIPSTFDLDDYMRHSVGVLRGTPVEITIRFDSLRAPYARRRHWEFPHTLEEVGDNLILRGTVAGLEEIRTELLRWGEGVTVIEPPELREAMLATALAIAAKYQK